MKAISARYVSSLPVNSAEIKEGIRESLLAPSFRNVSEYPARRDATKPSNTSQVRGSVLGQVFSPSGGLRRQRNRAVFWRSVGAMHD